LYDDDDDTLLYTNTGKCECTADKNKGFYRCKLHQNLGKKTVDRKGDGRNDSHLDIRITVSIVTRLRELQPEDGARFLGWAIDLFSPASGPPLPSPQPLIQLVPVAPSPGGKEVGTG
jgi:hypothetical protein